MNRWKQRGTIFLALLLVLVLGFQMFQGLGISEVQATAVNADLSTEGKIKNGDFESGRDGYSVKNWFLHSMKSDAAKETEKDWTGNFTLKTKSEDGNKFAALTKFGAGYAAMTSEHVDVESQQTYRLSIDYKIKDFSLDIDPATGEPYASNITYRGIRFIVEQLDASGNNLSYTKYPGEAIKETASAGWNTYYTTFTTKSNTHSVVVYCWLGGDMRVNVTALFDNVIIEPNDDYNVVNSTFDKMDYHEQGVKPAGIAGPAGWTLKGANAGGTGKNSNFDSDFKVTLEQDTSDRGKVAAVHHMNVEQDGYAILQSNLIPIDANKHCSVEADYKFLCYDENGVIDPDGVVNKGSRIILYYYNANEEKIGHKLGNLSSHTKNSEGNNDWSTISMTGVNTPENTKYVQVCLYAAHNTSGETTKYFSVYFDNVLFCVDGEIEGWTMERSGPKGVPRTDNTDYTEFYTMKKMNGGSGHEKALQLCVTRKEGTKGGVVIYSDPIQIQNDKEYTTSYNLKVENYIAEEDTNGNRIYGAVGVLRYLDSQGNKINGNAPEVCGNQRDNTDWKYFEYTFTPPQGAVSVQFGLVMGTNKMDICKNMTYSIDNILITEKEAHEDYQKDPAVTSSILYKQSALFVGDLIGSGLAEQAASYSEMQVTNACSDTTTVEEALRSYAGNVYDYLVVSGGMKENADNISVGSVTADTVYMDGMDYDTTTFAGYMEYTLGKVAEYYEKQKVVYVLTTNNDEYRMAAQRIADKWNVKLVVLENVSDAVANWNELIEPVEMADFFNCFEVPELLGYLTKRVDELVGQELSITTDIMALEAIRDKARQCPDTHAEYAGYQELVDSIEEILEKCEDFSPTICGATIAVDDPNVLSFVAISPKKVLTQGVDVKTMGILTMPVSCLDIESKEYKKDAILELGNIHVTDLKVTYTGAFKEYRVCQEAWDANPYTEYIATAYIVYEADGREYVFYSNNDYVNEVGIRTATDGQCIKSVFGVAKTVAINLAAVKQGELDYSSIGGEKNVSYIHTATEDTAITMLDVYRLIGDNLKVLETWLDEGGTTQ